jgi:hypothetical protein
MKASESQLEIAIAQWFNKGDLTEPLHADVLQKYTLEHIDPRDFESYQSSGKLDRLLELCEAKYQVDMEYLDNYESQLSLENYSQFVAGVDTHVSNKDIINLTAGICEMTGDINKAIFEERK